MRLFTNLVSMPGLWALVQQHLGAPEFKRELYRSKLGSPCRLLDFGCASGHLGDAFRELEYYGVDLDPIAIEAAKRRFRDQPRMHFLASDIRERPFPSEFFDEILFAGTAHHLDDGLLGRVLTELHYCLKCGGTVHLFDPVFREPVRWSHQLMRTIDQGKYTRTLPQILAIVEPLALFEPGECSYHPPYGALLQDCDFLYLPLKKLSREGRDRAFSARFTEAHRGTEPRGRVGARRPGGATAQLNDQARRLS
jgi:SAM-dependent methyltransferase